MGSFSPASDMQAASTVPQLVRVHCKLITNLAVLSVCFGVMDGVNLRDHEFFR